MSQWLFDLGNTRLKFAPLQNAQAGGATALPYHTLEGASDAMDALPGGSVAWVASVAPAAVTGTLLAGLSSRFERVVHARSSGHCGRFRSGYTDPTRLGVDRFLALLASAHDARDTLLVGVGTALTVDLLDREGRHHGGLIAPSPTAMRQALQARVEHLPADGGKPVAFAANTLDALAGGSIGAGAGLIERSLRQACSVLGRAPQLVMHGGGADALLEYLPEASFRPSVVLDGLAMWAVLKQEEAR